MKNEIKNLKASLEVVRDYAKEAENLVTQINKETENIRKEYDLTLPQIKDMIHEDMHVLKEFSNPKYPDTTRLTVCVGQENGLHFKAYILLSDEGEYKKAMLILEKKMTISITADPMSLHKQQAAPTVITVRPIHGMHPV